MSGVERNPLEDQQQQQQHDHHHHHHLHRHHSRASFVSSRSNIGAAAEPDPPRPGDPELPITGAPVDVGPAPDGGRDAWLCVAGTWIQLFTVFGLITSSGVLTVYYSEHQLKQYSRSTIAWITSIQPLCVFGFAWLSGRYFDVHGARTLTVLGTALAFIAVLGIAFSKEYYQFFLSHIAFGLSGTLIYAPATAIAGHWFLKKRSTAVGIIVGGSGIGGVVYPIFIQQLLKHLSFRDTMVIIACFNLALMVPAVFWVKARLPPRTPPPMSAMKRPFRNRAFVAMGIGTGMYGFNILTGYFNAATLAKANDTNAAITAYAVAILQAGSFVGRVVAGLLADRLGVWRVFVTLGFLTSATMFAFWTPPHTGDAPVLLGLLFYGALSGGWFTLAASATATIAPVPEVGTYIGVMWTSVSVPGLLGPVISGELITVNNNQFTYAGIFCGCTFLLSGLVTAVAFYLVLRNQRGEAAAREAEEGEGRSVGNDADTLPATPSTWAVESKDFDGDRNGVCVHTEMCEWEQPGERGGVKAG